MELESASSGRRNSMDQSPDMSEARPSVPGLVQERLGGFRRLYRRLRGTPVLGLGVRAAKGWTIAGLLMSAVALGTGLIVRTFSGHTAAAVGALVGAGAAVAVGVVAVRLRTRA